MQTWLAASSLATIGGLWLVYGNQSSEKTKRVKQHEKEKGDLIAKHWDYDKLTAMLANAKWDKISIKLPCFIVDLTIFDANVKKLCGHVKNYGKTMRLATKSVRSPYLIHRAMKIANGSINGLMCFSVYEIEMLINYSIENDCTNLFNDFLVGYPTMQQNEIELAWNLTQKYGKNVKICLMIDCKQQILLINQFCEKIHSSIEKNDFIKLGLCLDLDVCYRQYLFNFEILCLGAHRSNLHTIEQLDSVLDCLINECKYLQLYGLMGYEAHVAGLPCNNPFAPMTLPNTIVQFMKPVFQTQCNNLRMKMVNHINNRKDESNNLKNFYFVNGGGTGNIEMISKQDSMVTEVGAGSGLLQSQIFDYFSNAQCVPAACFALPITRIVNNKNNSNEKYIVCQSGGFIASGSISFDKQPTIFVTPNNIELKTYKDEGFGEVQTPLKIIEKSSNQCGNNCNFSQLKYGNGVFFRSAKAGEIAERFDQYILKDEKYNVVNVVQTYRGMGCTFY